MVVTDGKRLQYFGLLHSFTAPDGVCGGSPYEQNGKCFLYDTKWTMTEILVVVKQFHELPNSRQRFY
jgi:hypothetical protein